MLSSRDGCLRGVGALVGLSLILCVIAACDDEDTPPSCDDLDCSPNATCEVQDNEPVCVCHEGYTGDDCEQCAEGYTMNEAGDCVIPSLCEDDPCGERGTCNDATGEVICVCEVGYEGDYCESCYPGYHDDGSGACVLDETCLATTCDGHGSCDDSAGTVTCSCDDEYMGDHCESCAAGYHRDDEENCVVDEDCSASDPCGLNGSCDDTTGVVECICDEGYTGDFCEECYPGYHDDGTGSCLLDESCLSGTCSGHGSCDDSTGVVTCTCDAGYQGDHCEGCGEGFHRDDDENCVADEDCAVIDPCGDYGTCVDVTGVIECVCDLGYTGDFCESCYPGYHDDGTGSCVLDERCRASTCSGHGSCDDSTGVVTCGCDDGYDGVFCESCAVGYHRDADERCVPDEDCMASDPCGDHGSCDDSSGEIECVCDLGYTGDFCGLCYAGYHDDGTGTCVLDSRCHAGTCSGNGSCDDSSGVVSCDCDDGYAGANCASCDAGYHRDEFENCVADEDCATSDPCGDHGTCDDSSGEIECVCDLGYDGLFCGGCYAGYHDDGTGTCVLDESCLPRTCSGHGSCDDSSGEVICTCYTGYTGVNCSFCATGYHMDDRDRCTPDEHCYAGACGDHGTCNDSSGVIECVCDLGYTGPTCEDCYAGYHDDGTGTCVLDESCLANTCSGHGLCDDSGGEVICFCDPGYDGSYCESCAADYHREGDDCVEDEVCEPTSCGDHGDCDASSGVIVCECHDGWEGDDCDSCEDGYHREGDDCVIDEECEPDTCSEHGSCRVVNGLTECVCDIGHDGPRCEECYPGYEIEFLTGRCEVPCFNQYQIRCDDTCVWGTTLENCGDCDVVCAPGFECHQDGTTMECYCQYEVCPDGSCADFRYDEENCGGCDISCGVDEKCIAGHCMPYDPTGCGGDCEGDDVLCCPGDRCMNTEELMSDPFNCGGCDVTCDGGAGELCAAGVCQTGTCSGECESEQLCCTNSGGLEECIWSYEFEWRYSYCGSCDNECTGSEQCEYGLCVCNYPYARCGGICREVRFDNDNCGECSVTCDVSAGERCYRGDCITGDSGCSPDCETWELCCDGGCYDTHLLLWDPDHCGGCDPCLDGEECSDGTCYCWHDVFDYCGDPLACTDLTQPEHCGSCDNECPGDEQCGWLEDPPGYGCLCPYMDCGGECADISSNEAHCGGCGDDCDPGEICVMSGCVPPNSSSCGDCGDDAICCENTVGESRCVSDEELLWDHEHCGACGNECDSDEVCYNGTCIIPPGDTCDNPADFDDIEDNWANTMGNLCERTDTIDYFVAPCLADGGSVEEFHIFTPIFDGIWNVQFNYWGSSNGRLAVIAFPVGEDACDASEAVPLGCFEPDDLGSVDVPPGVYLIFVVYDDLSGCSDYNLQFWYMG